MEEILVTATRRAQSVMDVPSSISAYSGDALREAGANSLDDLAQFAAGMSFVDSGVANRSNRNTIALRGLSANAADLPLRPDGAVPAVSLYIGETPVFFPVKFGDIERIEVLRGPQGTLYGSGSLGGTVRIIPAAPDLNETSGRVNGSVGFVDDSDEFDRDVEAVVNIPIVPGKVAARLYAGYEYQAGFIDARGLVQQGENNIPVERVAGDSTSGFVVLPTREDINDATTIAFRGGLRIAATDALEIDVSYQYQDDESDNQQSHNPDFPGGEFDNSVPNFPGSLYENTAGIPGGLFPEGATTFPEGGDYDQFILGEEPYERDVHIANLALTYDLGFASVTSSTSYFRNQSEATSYSTGLFETTREEGGTNLASFYGFFPRMTVNGQVSAEENAWTQELRLASSGGERFDYVVGAYFQSLENDFDYVETIPGVGDFLGGFPSPSPEGDVSFLQSRTFEFEDVALFGELTWNVTDKWGITAGIRAFWQEFTLDFSQALPICGSLCAEDGMDPNGLTTASGIDASFEDQIFKINTSYALSEDVLVYATISEGFRRGGANGIPLNGGFASLPQYLTYEPDKATNYEIGIKGAIDRHQFSLSAYYIDWENFQFDTTSPSAGAFYVLNGSEARTLGVEIELSGQLTNELTYRFGYAYTDAELTEDLQIKDLATFGIFDSPPTIVDVVNTGKGAELPNVSEHTLALGLNYVHSLSGDIDVIGQINASYRSDAQADFEGNILTAATIDGFALVDLSLGIAARNSWTATLFVDNAFGELGETGGVINPARNGTRGRYIFVERPRTIGLRAEYSF